MAMTDFALREWGARGKIIECVILYLIASFAAVLLIGYQGRLDFFSSKTPPGIFPIAVFGHYLFNSNYSFDVKFVLYCVFMCVWVYFGDPPILIILIGCWIVLQDLYYHFYVPEMQEKTWLFNCTKIEMIIAFALITILLGGGTKLMEPKEAFACIIAIFLYMLLNSAKEPISLKGYFLYFFLCSPLIFFAAFLKLMEQDNIFICLVALILYILFNIKVNLDKATFFFALFKKFYNFAFVCALIISIPLFYKQFIVNADVILEAHLVALLAFILAATFKKLERFILVLKIVCAYALGLFLMPLIILLK